MSIQRFTCASYPLRPQPTIGQENQNTENNEAMGLVEQTTQKVSRKELEECGINVLINLSNAPSPFAHRKESNSTSFSRIVSTHPVQYAEKRESLGKEQQEASQKPKIARPTSYLNISNESTQPRYLKIWQEGAAKTSEIFRQGHAVSYSHTLEEMLVDRGSTISELEQELFTFPGEIKAKNICKKFNVTGEKDKKRFIRLIHRQYPNFLCPTCHASDKTSTIDLSTQEKPITESNPMEVSEGNAKKTSETDITNFYRKKLGEPPVGLTNMLKELGLSLENLEKCLFFLSKKPTKRQLALLLNVPSDKCEQFEKGVGNYYTDFVAKDSKPPLPGTGCFKFKMEKPHPYSKK